MDTIKENLEKWMREWLTDAIMNNLEPMFRDVQAQTAGLHETLSQSPSSYAGGALWDTALSVSTSVMMPLAFLLLSALLCIELIGWLNERNNMHNSSDVTWMFFRLFIKILVVVLVVQNAPMIINEVFKLGSYIVAQVPGGTDTGLGAGSLDAIRLLMEEKSVGYLMAMLLYSLIGRLGIILITIVIQVVVIGWMFKISLYASMGAVPFATLMNKEISGIGANYIKNLFALAFQGFFMFVIVVMYAALTQNVATATDPNDAIFTMLLYSVVLAYALFNTGSLSKSIFNAH